MKGFDRRLPAGASFDQVAEELEVLNADDAVSGILLQLPVPDHLDGPALTALVDPAQGRRRLDAGQRRAARARPPGLRSCTPLGVMELLAQTGVELEGAEAVVVGRSNLFGKPMAQLLLGASATVTICHSRTRDLARVCARADVLIAAVGQPAADRRAVRQAGRRRDRRRPQPADARGGAEQERPGRRRRLRGGVADRLGDHAGAGRRRADDDRLPAAQHAAGRRSARRSACRHEHRQGARSATCSRSRARCCVIVSLLLAWYEGSSSGTLDAWDTFGAGVVLLLIAAAAARWRCSERARRAQHGACRWRRACGRCRSASPGVIAAIVRAARAPRPRDRRCAPGRGWRSPARWRSSPARGRRSRDERGSLYPPAEPEPRPRP